MSILNFGGNHGGPMPLLKGTKIFFQLAIGTIYPTPPLGQDMTQGQFLSGV